MFKNKVLALGALVGGTALAMGNASAAAIDVTAVTTAISDTLTPVGSIGAGVLLVLVAVKTYKWIRRAM